MLTLLIALLVLCALPTSLVFAPHLLEAIGRMCDFVRRRVHRRRCLPGDSRRARREFSRLDRVMNAATAELPSRPAVAPIERVAADLRRLDRERRDTGRSLLWQPVIARVYDDRLRDACRQLGIAEYFDELSGVDLDIERLRVENALREAGMVIGPTRRRSRPEHR